MKKLLLLFVIMGIVFVAGCIGGEKATDTKTSTDAQTNQKTVADTSDLIIQQSDVPGLTMSSFNYIAFPKSSSLIEIDQNILITSGMQREMKIYEDTLPLGTRNVGQQSNWKDNFGRIVMVRLIKFDTNPKFNQDILKSRINNCANKGYQNIGDISLCTSGSPSDSPDVVITSLIFTYKNYFIFLYVKDEKEKSESEALRIAKIVKGRLN